MTSLSDLTLRQSVALVWRTLRSMRTALILLLMIGLASVARVAAPPMAELARARDRVPGRPRVLGHVLRPRRALRRLRVVVVRAAHHAAVRLAGRLPRASDPRAVEGAAHAADAGPRDRRVPAATRTSPSSPAPDAALEAARRTLRRRRFRVARDPGRPALAAEKGVAREVGSLAFHWAFILLLAGVIYGKGTGFSGFAVVVEGQTWIDAQANYDGQIRTGRFFDGDFTGRRPAPARLPQRLPPHGPADGLRLRGRPAAIPTGRCSARRTSG